MFPCSVLLFVVSTFDGQVAGASFEEAKKVLYRNNMDLVSALKELQTAQLLRLGIAERPQIEKALRATDWNLEAAASRLLDTV